VPLEFLLRDVKGAEIPPFLFFIRSRHPFTRVCRDAIC